MAKANRATGNPVYIPAPANRKKGEPAVDAVIGAEREYIAARRKSARLSGRDRSRKDVAALAISGGGIRSATFSLGILQALASKDLLRQFDYLSTVSGGGYLGSSLVWWLSGMANGKEDGPRFGLGKDFPYGTRPPHPQPGAKDTDTEPQRAVLRYLRQRGEYLTPGGGITLASGIAAVLRGILLNVPLLLFFLVAALVLLEWAFDRLLGGVIWFNGISVEIVGSMESWINQVFAAKPVPEPPCCLWIEAKAIHLPPMPLFYQALVALALLAAIVFILITLAYAGYSLFLSRWLGNYRLRRMLEVWGGRLIVALPALLLLGLLPFTYVAWYSDNELLSKAIPAAGVLFSIVVAGSRFFASGLGKLSFLSGDRIVKIAACSGLILLVASAYNLTRLWFPVPGAPGAPYDWLGALTLAALVFSLLVNINHVSLHRFYRDRLMEAFLPDWRTVQADRSRAVRLADRAWLAAFDGPGRTAGIPYLLINTNAVLVDSENLTWREWGGDNFVLSPLYCGSAASGWRSSPVFFEGTLSLASAMATSGAAANPNAVGVTRSRLVSLLMSILNLRLGIWVPNPRYAFLQRWRPNHFLPGASQAISRGWFGYQEAAAFVQLSDGGHFENLALYELIRRQAGLIVLCDGAADPEFKFEDFQQFARRVATDFHAAIDFEGDNGFVRLDRAGDLTAPNVLAVTRGGEKRSVTWPKKLKIARAPYVVGAIRYADGGRGSLIYIKATLIDGLPPEVLGYAAANPEFPHQTTADQFFDEEQFEAYRQLGYQQGAAIERELKPRLGRLA